jgi:hypothetical protein
MARLPDRFDLWVRKARESADPARQADWVLGALVARPELFFLNIGTKAKPLIAKTALDESVLVFTDAARLESFVAGHPALVKRADDGLPVIASPTAAALKWCVEHRAGLVINPTEGETALVPHGELAKFHDEWQQRRARTSTGFWIPNMTTQEEDFWQENGL